MNRSQAGRPHRSMIEDVGISKPLGPPLNVRSGPAGEVEQTLVVLAMMVEELGRSIGELEERLVPVTQAEGPEPAETSAPAPEPVPQCAVVERLASSIRGLQNIDRRVVSLIRRSCL
jgi:hypothetical protein